MLNFIRGEIVDGTIIVAVFKTEHFNTLKRFVIGGTFAGVTALFEKKEDGSIDGFKISHNQDSYLMQNVTAQQIAQVLEDIAQ